MYNKVLKGLALAIVFIAVMFIPPRAIAQCNPTACQYIEDNDAPYYIELEYGVIAAIKVQIQYVGVSGYTEYTAGGPYHNDCIRIDHGLGEHSVYVEETGNTGCTLQIDLIRLFYAHTGGFMNFHDASPPLTIEASGNIITAAWVELGSGEWPYYPRSGRFFRQDTETPCYRVQGIGTGVVTITDPLSQSIKCIEQPVFLRAWW